MIRRSASGGPEAGLIARWAGIEWYAKNIKTLGVGLRLPSVRSSLRSTLANFPANPHARIATIKYWSKPDAPAVLAMAPCHLYGLLVALQRHSHVPTYGETSSPPWSKTAAASQLLGELDW